MTRLIKLAALALVITAANISVLAQEKHPEHDAVMRVVDQFFRAINTGNDELMASISIDKSVIYSLREREDGSLTLRRREQDNSAEPQDSPKMTERYWDETLLVSDHLAVFWAPYDFYIEGEFSHCGTDAFEFIKVEGEWKMANSMYTVLRSGCPVSPLGELQE